MGTDKSVEQLKSDLKRPRKRRKQSSEMLSTGCTLLNLALSDRYDGGLPKGGYYFFVGDSQSGKTFLLLTILAEACQNPAFDGYQLVYDDVERGALMDLRKFFGKRVEERIEPPAGTSDEPIYSYLIEEFYANLTKRLDQGPCIYLLDSMDALSSQQEESKFEEVREAAGTGKEVKGDYGDGKAKINSRMLRGVISKLKATGSILIIVSQTRENINAGPFESKKTRPGGKALRFYATAEIWSSVGTKIQKLIRGKKRTLGINSRIKVEKNRIAGKNRTIEFPILYEIGIDDIGGCVDYLIEEGTWKKKGARIVPEGLLPEGEEKSFHRNDLIVYIEDNKLDNAVRKAVHQTWHVIEEACSTGRKARYE